MRPVLRCSSCLRRPRQIPFMLCRGCRSKLHRKAAKRRQARLRKAAVEQAEPPATPLPDLETLMAEADKASERALKLAKTLGGVEP